MTWLAETLFPDFFCLTLLLLLGAAYVQGIVLFGKCGWT
jgi:hypothetical protein